MSKRLFPVVQILNQSGEIDTAGAKVFTYETGGTTTPKATYQDEAGATSNGTSFTMDSDGRFPGDGLWLDTDIAYRIVVKSNDLGTTFFTLDNVTGILDPNNFAWSSVSIKFADGDGIQDSNGNEILVVEKVASAVNYVSVKNAATGNGVTVESKGTDSDVDLILKAKGTSGDVQFITRSNTITLPTTSPSANQFLQTDGSGNWSYGALTGLMAGQRSGGIMSNDTDADHDIAFSAGSHRDSSDTVTMTKATIVTKQIDAGWAAGDDAGGMPSGVALTGDTWYHCFKIMKSSTGVVDYGYDTSISAANLLSASTYDYYRYLGSVLTDSSANIIGFLQYDNVFIWKDPNLSINTTTLSTTSTAFTIACPPDVNCNATMNVTMTNASASSVYIRGGGTTDSAPSTTAAPLAAINCTAGGTTQNMVTAVTDTSKQVNARSNNSSTTLKAAVTQYVNLAL